MSHCVDFLRQKPTSAIVSCKHIDLCQLSKNPYNLNSRIVHQKGEFLFPTDLNATFMENLSNMLNVDGKPVNTKVIKINVELPLEQVIYLYKQLDYMNIGPQTLFESKLDSMGEVLKRKLMTSRFSDVLSLNQQGIL